MATYLSIKSMLTYKLITFRHVLGYFWLGSMSNSDALHLGIVLFRKMAVTDMF